MDEGGSGSLPYLHESDTAADFIVEPVERGRPWDVDDDDDDCLNKNSNWFCENTEN